MVHNRNKLLDLFIGNLANAILHDILEQAIQDDIIAQRYKKESVTSLTLATNYRAKLNPAAFPLPSKDIIYIKKKLQNKVSRELCLRIAKGYQHIDIALVDIFIDKQLKHLNVI